MRAGLIGAGVGAIVVVAAATQTVPSLVDSTPVRDTVIPQGTASPAETFRPQQPSYRAGLPAPPLERDPARPGLPGAPGAGTAALGGGGSGGGGAGSPATLRLYLSAVDLLQPDRSAIASGDARFTSGPTAPPPGCTPNGSSESDHQTPPLATDLSFTGPLSSHLLVTASAAVSLQVTLLNADGGCAAISSGTASVGAGSSTLDVGMSTPSTSVHQGSILHFVVTATSQLPANVDVQTSYSDPSSVDLPLTSCTPHLCN